jgi:hypothetical protein
MIATERVKKHSTRLRRAHRLEEKDFLIGLESMAPRGTTTMRPRSSQSLNNHKRKFPRPAASGITRAWKLVGTSTKSLVHKFKSLPGIASGVLFLLLKALLLLALAILITSWAFGEDSITIASFIDMTPSPPDTTTPKSKGLGQLVADALAFELDRISQLQTVKNPWGSPEQMGSPKVAMPEAYERVGSISVSGMELPVGELLLALKSFLPHFNQRQAFSGSIQRFSSDQISRIRIIARLEEDGKILKYWEVDKALKSEAEIVDLVKNLAFQIMWSTLDDIGTNSYYSFQYYIEGIELFRRYKDTHDESYFSGAERNLLAAIRENPEYVRAHFFLGSLYSWRFYYERNNQEIFHEFLQNSTKIFQDMENLYPSRTHVSKVLANYGLGLIAHRRYIKEKQENKGRYILYEEEREDLEAWLDKAESFYTKALNIDQKFYHARTARALVSKERNNLDHAVQELQKSTRQQRVEEECRKRSKSKKDWAQKQIDQLQKQKKRMEEEQHEVGVRGQETISRNMEEDFDKRNIIFRLLAIFSWSSSQEACT